MTKQEYYDLLVKSANDGTFPCINPRHMTCTYRGPDNKKCAVGILISDELYNPDWDRGLMPVNELPDDIITKIMPDGMNIIDLRNVQITHDKFLNRNWSAVEFIERLNALNCFKDVVHDKTGIL